MEPFVDTHGHLKKGVDWKFMDKIAGSGILRQVWLHHCPANHVIEQADEEEVLLCAKRYPGLYIPFGFIDFSKGAGEVERLREKGFTGLKAITPPKAYNDSSYFPIYAKAEELGMPILFHVGIIAKGFWNEIKDTRGFPGPCNMKPSMLDTIADRFPKLQLIQGHMGIPWVNELWESLYYYPNIACSVCGLVDYEWLIRHLDDLTGRGVPYNQCMMFGVDGMYGYEEGWKEIEETAHFMEDFFLRVGRTHTWKNAVRDFMAENALRLSKNWGK